MSYAFFSHTGDVGVQVHADSLDALFADAALALTDTVTDRRLVTGARQTAVELRSTAVDLLLIDWLNELIFRFDTEGLLIACARVVVTGGGDDWTVRGTVEGETIDAGRHSVKTVVKAATYHALEVTRSRSEWRATFVLDV